MTQVFPRVVDLSHHNVDDGTNINWLSVKREGIWGVIYKATEATHYVDETYDEARFQVKQVGGLLWGAYHFFRPGDVEEQVSHFLLHATPGPDTLLVLDHEDPGCSIEDVKLFLRLVEERTGQRPALYSGHVLKEQMGNRIDSYLAGTRLWLAQYGPELEVPPCWPKGAWLWQYTDGHEGPQPHTIDGIGACDINSFDGAQDALTKTWAEARVVPPKPTPPKPPRPPMPQPDEVPAWLTTMRAITGMTETPGSADNPAIMHMADVVAREYPEQASYAGYYTGDDVAWCGLTMAYVMTMAGIEPVFGKTDTERWMWALAWADWPESIQLDEPKLGCVVVMERDGGGHVTLFEGMDGGNYLCRGGNQSDMVNVASYSPSTVVALVWPRERPRVQVALDQAEGAWIQATLNVLGNAGLDVDGDLGPQSREAIANYQLEAELHATGIADKKTVAAMLDDMTAWNNARAPRNRR